jgi:hypothetical protein
MEAKQTRIVNARRKKERTCECIGQTTISGYSGWKEKRKKNTNPINE